MSDEQDKKINYKILTTEEILKESQVPTKAIEHREEKIEVPVTEKIDKKAETPAVEKIEERVEVIETKKKETGVLYPEFKEEPIGLGPIIPQAIPEIEKKVEIKRPEPIVTQPIEKKEEPKLQIQEKAAKNPKEEIFYFKPSEKLKFIQEIKETQIIKEEEKPRIKFNLNYVLIPGALIIILLLILFLKPYERIKTLLQPKENQPSEETISTTNPIQIFFPTTFPAQKITSPITFPTITVATLTQETTSQPTFPTITVSTETQKITSPITFPTITVATLTQETTTQIAFPTTTVLTSTQEIKQINTETPLISQEKKPETLPTKEINLPGKTVTLQRKDFESFLARQESFGTKINIKLLENGQRLSVDFPFDYFIKVKNSQELKDKLTGNYGFVIYYGYVRKYPILIFEIKDKNKVLKFNQNWEKTTMKNDLQTLFLGFQPPKTTNNFETKRFNNFSYRILNFGDNYKIIWAIVNNYLIYTTTETGLKEVLPYLQ